MANWDVFHADRLELERGLSAEAIRSALARGELRDDDLVRPAGSSIPWARIADIPELMAPSTTDQPAQHEPPPPEQPDIRTVPVTGCLTSRKSSRASRRSSRLRSSRTHASARIVVLL